VNVAIFRYFFFQFGTVSFGSRDNVGGITTRYGLDGPGIEFQWRTRFSAPVLTGSEAHPASYTMGNGSFPGVKRPVCGVDQPPPSSAEVRGSRAITLLPLWAIVACSGVNFSELTGFFCVFLIYISTAILIILHSLEHVMLFLFE